MLAHLLHKPAAFRVIDTHAGAGRYDLFQAGASRTGEWRDGIARVWEASQPAEPQRLLAPYLDAVSAFNPGRTLGVYPGSPLIAQSLLRPQDRLIACELEPISATSLAAALRNDRRAKALAIDGWTALGAYVPPKERRGVVLVDPPFEEAADFARLAGALAAAYRKWPTGIYMLWYPIKERDAPDALARRLGRLARPETPALRTDTRSAARGGRSLRLRPDRGQSAVHARAGVAASLPALRRAVAAGRSPPRLAGA